MGKVTKGAWSTQHYNYPFLFDNHKGKEQNHDGLDGEKEEKGLEGGRKLIGGGEERGKLEDKKEGERKGKRGLLSDHFHGSRPVALKVEFLKQSEEWLQFNVIIPFRPCVVRQ